MAKKMQKVSTLIDIIDCVCPQEHSDMYMACNGMCIESSDSCSSVGPPKKLHSQDYIFFSIFGGKGEKQREWKLSVSC